MRVGLIGAGSWGENYVRVLSGMGVLTVVADADPGTGRRLACTYPDIEVLADHQTLLRRQVDAVVVATPAPTHYEIARAALLAGKHALVEKPLAMSSKEAFRLASLARERGLVLMAGHLLLHDPAVQCVKRYMDSGQIGTIHSLHHERLKLGRVRAAENVLWSFGVHDVAVLLHLVGDSPREVLSTGQGAVQGGVEDDVHIHLHFEGGVHGHIHTSWLWPERRRRLTVVGSLGMLVYDEDGGQITHHHKSVQPDLSLRDEGSEVVFTGSSSGPLTMQCEHFLAAASGGDRPLGDGDSAAQVLRVLERAARPPAPATYRAHDTAVIDDGASIGHGTRIWHFSHVMAGARIGRDCTLGQNVFVGRGACIGNRAKIQNNVSVYDGVTIEDDVFLGPSCVFTNVKTPRATVPRNKPPHRERTVVRRGASVGANATIVCGVTIGSWALVGAGAVVTGDVEPHSIVSGVPARHSGWACRCGVPLAVRDGLGACVECGIGYRLAPEGELVVALEEGTAK